MRCRVAALAECARMASNNKKLAPRKHHRRGPSNSRRPHASTTCEEHPHRCAWWWPVTGPISSPRSAMQKTETDCMWLWKHTVLLNLRGISRKCRRPQVRHYRRPGRRRATGTATADRWVRPRWQSVSRTPSPHLPGLPAAACCSCLRSSCGQWHPGPAGADVPAAGAHKTGRAGGGRASPLLGGRCVLARAYAGSSARARARRVEMCGGARVSAGA